MTSLFLTALVIALVYFALTWVLSVKVNNYGFLDVAWSYGVAILAPFYALNAPGNSTRIWLGSVIGILWSVRLGTHILTRVIRHHPKEDPRYRTLRERWAGSAMFLAFFELQAVTVVVFSLPFLCTAFNRNPDLGILEIIGLVFAAMSLLGESIADYQMNRFKSNPENEGDVCQTGLWRYSRHPNYFFESMVWWGFFIFALPSPFGWITIVCPLLMLYFLLKVTGIPLTEMHSMESKGDVYREYQRKTSAFIPWFRQG